MNFFTELYMSLEYYSFSVFVNETTNYKIRVENNPSSEKKFTIKADILNALVQNYRVSNFIK